jgi:Acetyl-CoA acetyltransferase
VFTAIQAYYTVASGMADVVLAVAEEKMSSTQPHPQGAFLTIFDNILERRSARTCSGSSRSR